MSKTVKLIIEIPKEAKKCFDEGNDFKCSYYDHGGIIGKAIKNGIPLDDVKAEIKQLRSHSARFRTSSGRVVYVDSQDILDILDSIGSEVKPNEINN